MKEITSNPIDLFKQWHAEAKQTALKEPNSMTVATTGRDLQPNVRVVLLKAVDDQGFVFYTNTESDKANQLKENPVAALGFHWDPLRKQVRVTGAVEPVSEQEADAYFATRERSSQIGAWASMQSRPMKNMLELERRIVKYGAKYAVGPVPRPPFWSGFRVKPERIEFWNHRRFRLHERVCYEKTEQGWNSFHLYP